MKLDFVFNKTDLQGTVTSNVTMDISMVTTNGPYCVLTNFNFTETSTDKKGLSQKKCDREKTDAGESCRTIYIAT